ncbi:hypothetical protein [Bradyrhizobium sp. ORS 86]|uniref:hypothetical protein n=1 Tax=Bradyrhizobium sp. ORS 86 TaxID=1685970 RepID=UPI00388DAD43
MTSNDHFKQLALQLSAQGIKILLDIVATTHSSVESPYRFGSPRQGESKFDFIAMLHLPGLLLAKRQQ